MKTDKPVEQQNIRVVLGVPIPEHPVLSRKAYPESGQEEDEQQFNPNLEPPR